ncbi:MAG TPA: hypothetical protein PLG34_04410 [Spirochaetota bacterium]|jgi:hypothetical protein|nr:MAG: hypothetical protein BWX91_01411 [Spirochaetes bacterium ADurb.Bin133]HNZ25729.1 hypothetical protein [Spirochaetota bacterium]HPY87206.1 hypothetical protein [Spirochaetota bacterium]HQB62555.1 hypothetical protein [Spirochaetota bacterium]
MDISTITSSTHNVTYPEAVEPAYTVSPTIEEPVVYAVDDMVGQYIDIIG